MITTAAASSPKVINAPAPDTTLTGARLWIARAAWIILFIVSLLLYAAQVPLALRALTNDWQVERSAFFLRLNLFNRAYDSYVLFILLLSYAVLLTFVGVALYIAGRKSNDWVALLGSAMLVVLPQSFNSGGYIDNWSFYIAPLNQILPIFEGMLSVLGVVLLVLFVFLFPDGRFIPRWTAWIAVPVAIALSFVWFTTLLPIDLQWDAGWYVVMGLFFAAMVTGVGAQAHRYLHAQDQISKQQTRWVVLGFLALVIGFTIAFALMSLETYASAFITLYLSIALPLVIPLTLAVAMTRDRLWESNPFLNRALLTAALTAILILVYILTIAALSALFRLTNNFVIAAIATGIVAILFQPLRERLQRTINQLLYGERDDPLQVLYQLGAQLENTLAPDTALPLVVGTVVRTLAVPYAAIELASSDELGGLGGTEGLDSSPGPRAQRTTVAESGARTADCIKIPLRYQNETVGDLVVGRRKPNQAFSRSDLQLLETLGSQAGAIAYSAQLTTALKNSRERIILEREQERRRLRRDLHDELGPTLASQTLKLDTALDLLAASDSGTVRARSILTELKAQTQAIVTDIRRIVYELRPPALDDLGLVGALRAHIAPLNNGNGLALTFDAPADLSPLSAAVQVNAYRIVTEAVSNIVRHAHATQGLVRLTRADRYLAIEVSDNGKGFDPKGPRGVGINAMRERAEEVGGTLEITSAHDRGTRVHVTLPI